MFPLIFSCPADHVPDFLLFVVIPFILDVRLHLSNNMCFLSREGFSRPFPSSTVKSNFVYARHNRFPLVGHDVRENPSSCDCTEIRTHVATSEGFEVTN